MRATAGLRGFWLVAVGLEHADCTRRDSGRPCEHDPLIASRHQLRARVSGVSLAP